MILMDIVQPKQQQMKQQIFHMQEMQKEKIPVEIGGDTLMHQKQQLMKQQIFHMQGMSHQQLYIIKVIEQYIQVMVLRQV